MMQSRPTVPTTTPADAAPAAADHPDRAARRAAARVLIPDVVTGWLTEATTAALGQAVAVSITDYQRLHRQPPTWAEALVGVDPALLAPLAAVLDGGRCPRRRGGRTCGPG